ncbi:MAG: 23S rRNA (pseudouridine(1915)-N(3))-methyltransferase RlmH [Betaproteobacteria bacterium]|nr:23S rRNA (pseudouridine(1915)-N(3))-methyltransferase RlmH [Betaproteobacteria bacterium]
MRLIVLAVGTRMPGWSDAAFSDYARRMPRHLPLDLIELRAEPREKGKTIEALCSAEARRITQALPAGAMKVALDEHGREFTTDALSKWLDRMTGEGRDIAFLIGGADGLAPELKKTADLRLRLSAFTLPHALARVVLAEQLYRAASILQNHPYHRA